MTLFLTKLVSLFIYPLGAVILICVAALALSLTGWRRIGQVLLGSALFVLWMSATPVFAKWLNWRVASQVRPSVSLETLPNRDALILLGGTPCYRIVQTLRLYRAGKAPRIIITAGNLPWQRRLVSEAQRVADLLVELGAPRSALVLEDASRTTRENAVNTAAILKEHGWKDGFLVTSSTHMPRALAAFRRVGVSVTPAAIETHSRSVRINSLFDLLPDARALVSTTSAIKEVIGLYVYRSRGWA